jgi:type I restriction enzyme S subunit
MRPYLRVANVFEDRIDLSDVLEMNFTPQEYETYRLQHGDILLNEGQSLELVGRPAMYRGELPGSCFQNTLVRFRPGQCVLPSFALLIFRYYLHSQRFQKIAKWTVNIAHLGASRFAELDFPLPPIKEQMRIVEKFDEISSDLDAGVATLERLVAKLKLYRASVLKAASEGHLTAEWRAKNPAAEPASELVGRILDERRRKWEEKKTSTAARAGRELVRGWEKNYVGPEVCDRETHPTLPEGWCLASVGQISLLDVGFAFKSAEFSSNGIRLLRGENIEPGALRWIDVKHWPESKAKEFENLLIEEGDIILAMDRPLISTGLKIARARAADLPCLLVQRMARFKPLELRTTPYLFLCLQTRKFINHLVGGQTGTQLPHISGSSILSFKLPLPPLSEQLQIVAESERRLSIVDEIEAQVRIALKRSSHLRQIILKQAVEGRLVPQDPNEEPSDRLLESIRGERRNSECADDRAPDGGKRRRRDDSLPLFDVRGGGVHE